jgi:mono/diheme cytochrome c family protein
VTAARRAARVVAAILLGCASEQAAASQLLSDAQIAEIVNYIRSRFGNHYPERITAASVAALRHPLSTPAYY